MNDYSLTGHACTEHLCSCCCCSCRSPAKQSEDDDTDDSDDLDEQSERQPLITPDQPSSKPSMSVLTGDGPLVYKFFPMHYVDQGKIFSILAICLQLTKFQGGSLYLSY
jgi:hypothetical protein